MLLKKPFLQVFQREMDLICDWMKATRHAKVISFDSHPEYPHQVVKGIEVMSI